MNVTERWDRRDERHLMRDSRGVVATKSFSAPRGPRGPDCRNPRSTKRTEADSPRYRNDDREQRRAVRARVCIDAESQGDNATPTNGLQ